MKTKRKPVADTNNEIIESLCAKLADAQQESKGAREIGMAALLCLAPLAKAINRSFGEERAELVRVDNQLREALAIRYGHSELFYVSGTDSTK